MTDNPAGGGYSECESNRTIIMKQHHQSYAATLATALCAGMLPAAPAPVAPHAAAEASPRVQLALLLDTSSSMDGLIHQARTQLWQIVNTFIHAKQDGKTPFVEVALYEYGNSGLPAEGMWIRRVQPLTRDLDKLSEELFALHTNGGEEYCGAVIGQAVADLHWDPSPKTYKAIFIAGNEPFTQGPVKPADTCGKAIAQGIIVNTIHCGTEEQGIAGGWRDGASRADGRSLVIDAHKTEVPVPTPYDVEICKLNERLNTTYLPFGKGGAAGADNQIAQDANAAKAAPAAAAQRVATKASGNYVNSSWDLVDAAKAKDFDLAKIEAGDLPAAMRGMTLEQRKAHLAKNATERETVRKEIQNT